MMLMRLGLLRRRPGTSVQSILGDWVMAAPCVAAPLGQHWCFTPYQLGTKSSESLQCGDVVLEDHNLFATNALALAGVTRNRKIPIPRNGCD